MIKLNEKGTIKYMEVLDQFKDAVVEKTSEYDGLPIAANAVFFVDSVNFKKGKITIVLKNSSRLDAELVIVINPEKLKNRINELGKVLRNKNYNTPDKIAPKKVAPKRTASKKSAPKKKVVIKKAKA